MDSSVIGERRLAGGWAGLVSFVKARPHALVEPLAVYAVFRLSLFALGLLSQIPLHTTVRPYEFPGVHPLLAPWARWDGAWYLLVALEGYESQVHAWFPLYPLTIRAVGYLTGDLPLAGFLVANVSFVLALIALYNLVERRFGRQTALRSCIFLAFSPFALFFGNVYTESLFLLLALVSFSLAERERWWLAGVVGAFCAATRVVGAGLAPALLVLYLQRRGLKWREWDAGIAGPCLVPLGTLAFMTYLYLSFGDPLAFYHNSMIGWQRINIFDGGLEKLNMLEFSPESHQVTHWMSFLAGLFALAIVVPAGRLLGWGYGIFVLVGTAIPLWAGVDSLARYVTVLFPIFVTLAYHLRGQLWPRLLVACWAMLLGMLTILHISSYPIT